LSFRKNPAAAEQSLKNSASSHVLKGCGFSAALTFPERPKPPFNIQGLRRRLKAAPFQTQRRSEFFCNLWGRALSKQADTISL
jgi:hypothetical protein